MARISNATARKFGLTGKPKARLDREAKVYPSSSFDLREIVEGTFSPKSVGWMIWLPWPPSNNKYWRRYRNVTTIGPDGKAYLYAVEAFFADKRNVKFGDKRLSVTIRLNANTKRSFDLDNFAKVVLDSLGKADVFDNDSQIDILTIERGLVMAGMGQAVVTIRAL